MLCCPEKDLISVYIDGELPEKYKAEFEEHLKNCPDCEKTYKAFLRQKEFFTKDAKQFNLDAVYMDQAYSRLQARMSYSKVRSKNKNILQFAPIAKAVISSVAAAAVFALILVPVFKNANLKSDISEITPIARTEIEPLYKKNIVVDENIAKSTPILSSGTSPSEDAVQNPNQKIVSGAVASFGDSISNMSSIDVFKPEFEEGEFPMIRFSITIDGNFTDWEK